VIVPGNHDIDWAIARSAMNLVTADDQPENLSSELYQEKHRIVGTGRQESYTRSLIGLPTIVALRRFGLSSGAFIKAL